WTGVRGAGRSEALRQAFHRGLEPPGNGDELPIHWIGSAAERFESHHGKDRLGARFAEYADRRLDPAAHPDVDPRHRVEDLASVRQHERPLVLRHDTQAFQDVPGNPGVGRAGVHQGVEGLEAAAGPVTHLDRHVEVPHPRIFHCFLDTGLCVRLESTLGGAESAGPKGPRLSSDARASLLVNAESRVYPRMTPDRGSPLRLTRHRVVSRGNPITPLRFPTMTVAADDVLG